MPTPTPGPTSPGGARPVTPASLGATRWQQAAALAWHDEQDDPLAPTGHAAGTDAVAAAAEVLATIRRLDAAGPAPTAPPPHPNPPDPYTVARLRLTGWTWQAIAEHLADPHPRPRSTLTRAWRRALELPASPPNPPGTRPRAH